jgi:hypothetical protein
MKKLLVAVLIAGSLVSFEARAQGRAGSAALGAVSGAIVLGPVGAVAGALIGFTAGPAIAHSWGVGRSTSQPRSRYNATQSGASTREIGAQQQASAKINSPPPVKSPEALPEKKAAPPVQGFE